MVLVGLLVTSLIEDGVTRHAGATTALYVDSVVAPLLPDMQQSDFLDDATSRALDETLSNGALGERIVSFRLWRRDGTILYSNEKNLIGKRFTPNPKLARAFTGQMVTEFEQPEDEESQTERAMNKPLLEIYNPLLQPWSGQVVAVLEFYEVAEDLERGLWRARLNSWFAVAAVTGSFFLILSVVVFRGSRMIDQQRGTLQERVSQLSTALDANAELTKRIQGASRRASALNERYLRRIGADLHDGPAQLVAFAALRLDSQVIVGQSSTEEREREAESIKTSLDEAMDEIRSICTGLVLPHIEAGSLSEILSTAVAAHEHRTDTNVWVNLASATPVLSSAEKICIYRFVQEALNNAYRHAGGVGQTVTSIWTGPHLVIEVADGGQGFDPDSVSSDGIGLAGMRERVESVGGLFMLRSSSAGTIVRMSLKPTSGPQE